VCLNALRVLDAERLESAFHAEHGTREPEHLLLFVSRPPIIYRYHNEDKNAYDSQSQKEKSSYIENSISKKAVANSLCEKA